jgi:hypothetical protein
MGRQAAAGRACRLANFNDSVINYATLKLRNYFPGSTFGGC